MNEKLSQKDSVNMIEVRGYNEMITNSFGLKRAFEKARKIGKKYKALLVVWGERIERKKFHPRISIVNEKIKYLIKVNRLIKVQNIPNCDLPQELVNEPIYLTNFIIGYNNYWNNLYPVAAKNFEDCMRLRTQVYPEEISAVQYYLANCYAL
ncbi:MAG: hypothetical protein ACFFD1_09905 [Candidatus Thorarchaeota archaeon]